jgi:membrane protein
MRDTVDGWTRANGSLLAAGLAYYAIFSLAPLLMIVVSVAGLVFSKSDVTEILVQEIGIAVNPRLALAVQSVIESREFTRSTILATGLSVLVMILGASIVFVQVKKAINLLWGIAPQPGQGLFITIRTQFLSFLMVLVIGVLLVVFMVVSTILVSLNQFLDSLPQHLEVVPQVDLVLIFVGFVVLFALIFKILPDAKIAWRDVWLGAALTSFAFTLGELVIGYYLGETGLRGLYQTVGSIFLILAWVYYSMQILLLGAKFTQIYANRYGSKVLPSDKAGLIIQNFE